MITNFFPQCFFKLLPHHVCAAVLRLIALAQQLQVFSQANLLYELKYQENDPPHLPRDKLSHIHHLDGIDMRGYQDLQSLMHIHTAHGVRYLFGMV